MLSRIIQKADRGALPQLRAAVDPQLKGGEYFGPDSKFEMSGHPVQVQSNKLSRSKKDAKELWHVSEKLTKVRFEFE